MTGDPVYRFKLYIAGGAQNSAEALANLEAICKAALPERYTIEIIDVFKEPGRALQDRIFMTPTLVKLAPGPIRKIVGTLSEARTVLRALDLAFS